MMIPSQTIQDAVQPVICVPFLNTEEMNLPRNLLDLTTEKVKIGPIATGLHQTKINTPIKSALVP